MGDIQFNVSTKISDRSGMDQLTRWLADTEDRAKRINGLFSNMSAHNSFGNSRTQLGSSSGTSGPPPRRGGPAGAGGPSYNMNTQSGLYQWDTQVFAPVEQMLRSANQTMNETATSGGTTNPRPRMNEFQRAFMQKYAPSTVPRYKTVNPTFSQQKQWFNDLSQQMTNPNIPQEAKNDYFSASNSTADIKGFIDKWGSQLGAPAPTTVQTNNTNTGLSAELGGALGGMAKQYLPMLTIGGAAMYTFNQFRQGYSSWQQNSSIISPLAHSLSQTATDVEKFRMSVVNAGAQFGWTMQQSAQAATMFAQSFGNLSQGQVSSLVGQTALWGFNNGVSPQQSAQITSTAAKLGITSGVGSSMSTSQFLNMVTNMTTQGHMAGRQGEVATSLLDLTNTISTMNPIVQNQPGLAGVLAQMDASGIQGLQGLRGAAMAGQFANGVMNAQGLGQNLGFAAIMKASGGKIGNPYQMEYLLQSGPQAKIPGANTTVGEALLRYVQSQSSNPYVQESLLVGAGVANSLPAAHQWMLLAQKDPNLWNSTVSTQNNQQPWYSTYDINNITGQQYAAQQSALGIAVAPFVSAWHSLGPLGTTAAVGAGSWATYRYIRGGLSGLRSGITDSATAVGSAGDSLFSRIGGLFKGAGSSTADAFGSSWAATGAETVARRIPIIGAVVGTALDKASGKSWGRSLFDNAIGTAGSAAGTVLGALVPGADLTGVSEVAGATLGYTAGHAGANWLYSQLFGPGSTANKQQLHAVAHATNTQQVQSRLPVSSSNGTIKQLTIDTMTINHLNMPRGSSSGLSSASNGNVYAPTSSADGGANFGSLNWFQNIGQKVSNFLSGGTGGGQPGATVTSAPGGVNNWLSTINAAAAKYHVPANIIAAVMETESGGNMYGPNGKILTSSTGALGLMQLEPGTAASLGVNPTNPTQNIMGGAKYLAEMYKQTGSWDNAIQAYNGGPGNVGSGATEAYLQTVLSNEKTLTLHPSSVAAIGQAVGQAVANNNSYAKMHTGAVRP